VTLSQLQTFVTVARLGSVKAAAEALRVSEPAVSGAVAALRRDLGDELFVRAGGGIVLTPGGRELTAVAAEILGLADQARRAVREARGEATLLRIAATSMVAEYVAAPLLDAFTRRTPHVEVSLGVERATALAQALADRRADVALGPRPPAGSGLESVPFLRYRVIAVAGPRHRLAGRRSLAPFALAGEPWLTGPTGVEPLGSLAAFLARERLEPEVITFASHAAALSAVAAGEGVGLAILHTVRDELSRGSLVRLDVRGTPFDRLWHATTLPADRRPPAAWSLWRFVTTPEAMQAMLARSRGVTAGRFRPAVYVTLWS
jgi:LysR family transcriptional regulator, low CO2-responsive transcriptional regulator